MINLVNIFEKQAQLNAETAAKHVEYQVRSREQLTKNYIFAALCEIGEMSNEWGQFKIWKSSRKENRKAICKKCSGEGKFHGEDCPYCHNGYVNPLREEYVDVVHFVVSVAIGFDLNPNDFLSTYKRKNVSGEDTYQLILDLYENLVYANILIEELQNHQNENLFQKINQKERLNVAKDLLDTLLHLGYSLGFDDEEIENAYFDKHRINQVRQANNY